MSVVPAGPSDPAVEQRIADAADYRREIADRLACSLGAGWTEIPHDEVRPCREQLTLAAMRAGARYICGAQLPADLAGGRHGAVDLLVWDGDGYVPVLIVRHKVTDAGCGALTSALSPPVPGSRRPDPLRKTRAHPRDQLRLAHAVRLLEACGSKATGRTVGGVIGVDADVVVWHDLEAPTWPDGRTALTEYDARFADRLAIAMAAAAGTGPLAQPSRITECRACPWWLVCGQQLRAQRDVSLVVRGEDAAALRGIGIRTVDDLATMPPQRAETLSLTAARPEDVVTLAKAWLRGLSLVRRVHHVEVPRADVEIDVDMESYADSGAYLWGCWLSGADIGDAPGYRSFVSWDPLPSDDEARSFAEFWTFFSSIRRRASAGGLSFRAYCYNELAENRWMLASAEQFAGKPGIPTVAQVREFIESDQWVDLFLAVRDQFLCPSGKGLKVIAPRAGFAWRDAEAGGENSMRWYRDAVGFGGSAPALSQRSRLLEYNEDDVRATWTLRRWMTSPAVLEVPHADDL